MNYLLAYILLIICVLISVAFVTLLERKVLGYIQFRKGPNKVGVLGVFQPFSDALKLMSKEFNYMLWYNMFIYFLSPLISFMLMLLFWFNFPWMGENNLNFDLILILCVSSLGVYVILMSGWSSNSKYALLGAYRGVAQTISYEVSFSFIMLSILIFNKNFKLVNFMYFQESLYYLFGLFLLLVVWILTMLAELNRTPFDFSEGESELVSGFNVEYSGGGFTFLFLAEYGNIIFLSLISALFFFMWEGYFFMNMMLFIIFILWVRGTYIRFRYDNLMFLTWKLILPFSIFMLLCNMISYMYMISILI